MTRPDTAIVRLEPKTKAALDIVVAELYATTGKVMTQSEVIWYLIQIGRPEVAERIEKITREEPPKGLKN